MNDSTLRQDVFTAIRALIEASKASWGASSTITVYGYHPDLNTIAFPIIEIEPVKVDNSEFSIGVPSSRTSNKNISVNVFVFTKSNIDLEKISDGFSNMINTSDIPGVNLINSSEDYALITPNDNKIKVKSFTLNYIRR